MPAKLLLDDSEGRSCSLGRRTPEAFAEAAPALANFVGHKEELACGEVAGYAMVAYGCQSHRRDASALGTVRITAELAGRDSCLEVGGDGARGARKDALIGAGRRVPEFPEERIRHLEFGEILAQALQFGNDRGSLAGREDFDVGRSALRSEYAEPYLCDFGARAPEGEIGRAHV